MGDETGRSREKSVGDVHGGYAAVCGDGRAALVGCVREAAAAAAVRASGAECGGGVSVRAVDALLLQGSYTETVVRAALFLSVRLRADALADRTAAHNGD